MPYIDKEKQREAVRLATQRYRQRQKGITQVSQSVTDVIPVTPKPVIPSKPQSYNPMMVGYVPPTD